MKITGKTVASMLCLMLATAMFSATGCTKYAGPDDLQQLEAARKAVQSAQQKYQAVSREHENAQKELQVWEDSLKVVKAEYERVSKNRSTE